MIPLDPLGLALMLEGVAKSLDGVDLLAIIPTGGGKTAYFSMYMLALLAISENPHLCSPPAKVPSDPAMIITYPTICLEQEMVSRDLCRPGVS